MVKVVEDFVFSLRPLALTRLSPPSVSIFETDKSTTEIDRENHFKPALPKILNETSFLGNKCLFYCLQLE